MKVLSLPLSLLATILLARGLGPAGFGQYAFVVALITVLTIPIGRALMQLVTREVAKYQHANEENRIRVLLAWASRNLLSGASLLILSIGGYAAAAAGWEVNDRWTLVLVGLAALPFLGLNQVRVGVLSGLRHVVMAQLPEMMVRPSVLLLAATVLYVAGVLSPLTAVAAFVGAAAIACVVSAWLLRRQLPVAATESPNTEQSRQWRRAWMPFTLLAAASTLNGQIGVLLLGWLSTDEQVAAMQVADRGAMLVALSLIVVNMVITPHITRMHQAGDGRRLQMLSRQSARAAFLIALPVALPLIFLSGPIVSLVFGNDYAEIAATPTAILASGQLLNVAFGSVGRLLAMSGYERTTVWGQVSGLIVIVVTGLILVPPFGAQGAACSVVVGIVVWNLVLAINVYQKLNIRPTVI